MLELFGTKSEMNLEGDTNLRGDPNLKNRFLGLKATIFGAEGTENFEKMAILKEKVGCFCSFRGKFGGNLIDIVVLD